MQFIDGMIVGALLGFLAGYLPNNLENMKLKKKPLPHSELVNLPIGTEVILQQYRYFIANGEEKVGVMHKSFEDGSICMVNGRKKINVGDGYTEFTDANVWLKN